jgi:hypothetical protein
MEFKHESTIIKSALIITLSMQKKIRIWKLGDQIGPIDNKLKNKNYRGHGKSCIRMENPYKWPGKCAVPFAWFSILGHDFP